MAYSPVLWRTVNPTTIIVLQEAESVENVHHKANRWKLHIDPTAGLGGSVVVEGHIQSRAYLQLQTKREM